MTGALHTEHVTHTGPLWRWTGGANGGTWHFSPSTEPLVRRFRARR
ncbi:hypothetical protein [Novosphingobium sp. PhB165]|nr:hypothetical protein [Novosphingobium sp. PhB165]